MEPDAEAQNRKDAQMARAEELPPGAGASCGLTVMGRGPETCGEEG